MLLNHIIKNTIPADDTQEEIATEKAHFETRWAQENPDFGITWYTIHYGQAIELTGEATTTGLTPHRQIVKVWLDGEQPEDLWVGSINTAAIIAVPHFFWNEDKLRMQPTTLADLRRALDLLAKN